MISPVLEGCVHVDGPVTCNVAPDIDRYSLVYSEFLPLTDEFEETAVVALLCSVLMSCERLSLYRNSSTECTSTAENTPEPTRLLMGSCFHCAFLGAISADASWASVFDCLPPDFLNRLVVQRYCRFSWNVSQLSAARTAVLEEEGSSYRRPMSMPAAEYSLLLFGEVGELMPTGTSLMDLPYQVFLATGRFEDILEVFLKTGH